VGWVLEGRVKIKVESLRRKWKRGEERRKRLFCKIFLFDGEKLPWQRRNQQE